MPTGSPRADASLGEVGFIHSSTAAQLSGVAEAFYADETRPLVVLVMDDEAIRASGVEVVFEDAGDGELFPHVYGPIDPSTVTDVRPAAFDDAWPPDLLGRVLRGSNGSQTRSSGG